MVGNLALGSLGSIQINLAGITGVSVQLMAEIKKVFIINHAKTSTVVFPFKHVQFKEFFF